MPIELWSPPDFTQALADLRARLGNTRWSNDSIDSAWTDGISLSFLREICDYWRHKFDWERAIERFCAWPHYRFTHEGLGVHFLRQNGGSDHSIPLLLTHGWPGSFLEFLRIIPLLSAPAKQGPGAERTFDVIVPSLPGFGFSDHPPAGTNVFRIAKLWSALMSELGYSRFAAQGGDLGAGVTTALGLESPERLLGIHLNFIPGSYRPFVPEGEPLSSAEQDYLARIARWSEDNGAYAHLQRTRPRTAACGLNDSPAGLAAWILEKFREWSDCGGDVYSRFSADELLTNLTLYWVTQSVYSSFRLYYENRVAPLLFGPADYVHVPCAIAHFPRELPFPPREWVARGYNVQRWTEMERGGHFAAAEEPELLAADLRAFFADQPAAHS